MYRACCRKGQLQEGPAAQRACCRKGMLRRGLAAGRACCAEGMLQEGAAAGRACCTEGLLHRGPAAQGACCRKGLLQLSRARARAASRSWCCCCRLRRGGMLAAPACSQQHTHNAARHTVSAGCSRSAGWAQQCKVAAPAPCRLDDLLAGTASVLSASAAAGAEEEEGSSKKATNMQLSQQLMQVRPVSIGGVRADSLRQQQRMQGQGSLLCWCRGRCMPALPYVVCLTIPR